MSKTYTIDYFIRRVKRMSWDTTPNNFPDKLSPNNGVYGKAFEKLSLFLDYHIYDILHGIGEFKSLGSSPKSRVIKALKLRKENGVIKIEKKKNNSIKEKSYWSIFKLFIKNILWI